VLTVGYDIENLNDPGRNQAYTGEITTDYYGRKVPKHAHGTAKLETPTSSAKKIIPAVMELFDRIVNKTLLVRRMNLTAGHVVAESMVQMAPKAEQMNLFLDYDALQKQQQEEAVALARERRMQETVLGIKEKYGKNAILKAMNLQEGATAKERNNLIGGHRAGSEEKREDQ